MTLRVVEQHRYCDRCGKEMDDYQPGNYVWDLTWMNREYKRNGSMSGVTRSTEDLCKECSKSFQIWLTEEQD